MDDVTVNGNPFQNLLVLDEIRLGDRDFHAGIDYVSRQKRSQVAVKFLMFAFAFYGLLVAWVAATSGLNGARLFLAMVAYPLLPILVLIYLGAMTGYNLHGKGQCYDICTKTYVPRGDRFSIMEAFASRYVDELTPFETEIKEDFQDITNTTIFSEPAGTIEKIQNAWKAHPEYIALFFLPCTGIFAVSALVFGLARVERIEFSVGMILTLVIIEELFLKGIWNWVIPTLDNRASVMGRVISKEGSKGMVAGGGFAFAESFFIISNGVDWAENLIVRFLFSFPAHMMFSMLVFIGLGRVAQGWKAKSLPKCMIGIVFIVVPIFLHFLYNMVVWGYENG